MRLVALGLTAAVLAGCVTTAGIAKGDRVRKPLLFGAIAGDLVVTGVIASQAEDFSTAASVTTALAVTAVDIVGGCLFGACNTLRLW